MLKVKVFAVFFEQFILNLVVVIMATADKNDNSSPEHPCPYLNSRFNTFDIKKIHIILNLITEHKRHYFLQKFAT